MCNFGCSASLLRETKAVLNAILVYFEKTFFFVKSNLEMIGKDAKFDYLYVKLKPAFKTSSQLLNKLVENMKIRLGCNFEGFMLEGRVAIVLFENCCATNLAHISDVR